MPLRDQRLAYAAVIGTGVFLSLLLLVGLVFVRLTKVKREFDGDGTLFVEAA
jgi:hypothetical protein